MTMLSSMRSHACKLLAKKLEKPLESSYGYSISDRENKILQDLLDLGQETLRPPCGHNVRTQVLQFSQ